MVPAHARFALLAVVLAVSGCVAAAPTADARPADGNATQVTLENSTLDLDAARTFAEIESLVDEDLPADPPVYVLRGRDAGSGALSYPYTPYGFLEDLALTDVGPGGDGAAGLTDGTGTVYLVAGNRSHATNVKVLAHEFVHAIQFRAELLPWSQASLQGNVPTDLAQTRLALTEGSAVWVTDGYVRRHMAANVTLQSTEIRRAYEDARVGGRYFLARYHFGFRGVDRRLDDPSELRELFEPPVPNTTEQLLHGDTPADEPPRRFEVEAADAGEWTVREPDDEDVMGELFVRVALSKELSLAEAADAAAGWGYDRLIEYERDDESAFAWITRWDDPANASAFATAFETYTDRRETADELTFGVRSVGDDVVVVYSGPPAFVDAARASVDGETVRVRVGQ